ncbi:MAG: PAS domain S-box protein [Thermodesulfobacteriota bacterium]
MHTIPPGLMTSEEEHTMSLGRILIVEHDVILGKELARALESEGHEVVGIASSGSEAIRKASETLPDLVLIAIRLEGDSDGIEVAQAIVADQNPAVVYVAAHAEKELFERAKVTRPYGYLTKPVAIPELHRAVELALYTHQMEKRLRASEEKFRLLYEDAPLGYQSLDKNGYLVEVNRAWLEALGYTREEAIGRWLGDFLTPKSRETFLSVFPQFRAAGKTGWAEMEMLRKDGSILIASFDGRVARDEQGNFTRTHCILHDISARKQAEEALRQQEAQFRLVFENTRDPIFWADADTGIILRCNKAAERLMEKSRNEIEGYHFTTLHPPEDEEACSDGFREHVRLGDAYEAEVDVLTKSGKRVTVSISGALTDIGGRRIAQGIFRDITQRKTAEAALRRSEERYRMIFTHAPLGIMHFDENGTIVDFNDRFAEIIGAPREEILGFNMPQQLKDEHMLAAVRDCLTRGSGYYEGDYRSVTGDRLTPVRCLYNKMVSDSGEFLGAVGLFEDVSERRRFEKEKDSLQEQLFQAQKMEAIGTLAGGIAHDFNNLLQVVLGYADYLGMEEGVSERIASGLAEMKQAATNGAELVRGLLTLSRKIEPRLIPLNVNAQIEQVCKILQRTLQRMITIEFVPAQGLPPVHADPVQIEQVLINLAVNARDAMPEGGRLIFEAAKVSLDTHYWETHIEARPGTYVQLTVSDTGRGMDADTAKRIFEPFFSTKASGEGTGLGLAIAYGIVKQHGGFIQCDSRPGMGTSFHVFLPAIGTETAPEDPSPFVKPPGGTETILLVDDEQPIRRIGAAMLSRVGYRVITASNGKEALELYRRDCARIDLVILDLIMPVMGGEQCLTEILRLNPKAKVIIASGHAADGHSRETVESGAKGFVGKPYAMPQLLSTVREVLDQGRHGGTKSLSER